ncbi:hypothetical protein HUT16_33560 [Kitasatospora sp. NA04385]|nr:hypothetical protein [Kitasatospora sp. NA04385]QKW23363.1 hypothetical protein HUT16_33560 [Kitasatospora sp. NA04385]
MRASPPRRRRGALATTVLPPGSRRQSPAFGTAPVPSGSAPTPRPSGA